MSSDDYEQRIIELEDRIAKMNRLLSGLQTFFIHHLQNEGFTIIPSEPTDKMMTALAAIPRGKGSKNDYLRAVYHAIAALSLFKL